jgi:FtsH-binding integral membrane protein
MMFLVYSALNGMTLSMIFLVYTSDSILNTFIVSSAMFGAMSAFGYITKRDLTSVGSFFMMGLFGIIIASVVNIFLDSSALNFAISIIGVFVFIGLTAYDTQKIKSLYASTAHSHELASNVSIIAALTLYLDFINLFLFILRLLGRRK